MNTKAVQNSFRVQNSFTTNNGNKMISSMSLEKKLPSTNNSCHLPAQKLPNEALVSQRKNVPQLGAPHTPKGAPNTPKAAPNTPKDVPNTPKGAPNTPKGVPNTPKGAPNTPKPHTKTIIATGTVHTHDTHSNKGGESLDEIPLLVAFFNFLSFAIVVIVGYIKDFARTDTKEKNREDYAPLFVTFETFFLRYVFRLVADCFNRPICSLPGEYVTVMERKSNDCNWNIGLTGKTIRSINMGSFNYLGFAQTSGPCHDTAEEATKRWGVSVASSRTELGTLAIHKEMEALTAEFLGVEDAISFGMGFATNALNLPSLLGPGCLVMSDECNHASLILGIRLSGATVKVFRHNDCPDLEKRLRRAIIDGHPRTHRPYKKAFIVVEGIFSMEGTICNLPKLIQIKKKYKAYLYIDEAHSIGALGSHGRGVVDYHNCDSRDVDILMGTYSKSFASAGGYIAGRKDLIQHLRIHSDAQHYGSSIAPPVVQQIITSMSILMGKDGTDEGKRRLEKLERNIHYFYARLKKMGLLLMSNGHSPVIPVIGFTLSKLTYIIRCLTERGIAAVAVAFPATKITGARLRFCISAAHDKEMLDTVLDDLDQLSELVCCKIKKHQVDPNQVIEW